MSSWSDDQLRRIGEGEELELASRRPDGTLSGYVTIWVVAVGDGVYVRSAGGPDRSWYRRAIAAGEGRIRCGGADTDVTFAAPGDDVQATIDAAYHAKYDRYGPSIVGSVVGPDAHLVAAAAGGAGHRATTTTGAT
jgi:hypothetical protein